MTLSFIEFPQEPFRVKKPQKNTFGKHANAANLNFKSDLKSEMLTFLNGDYSLYQITW